MGMDLDGAGGYFRWTGTGWHDLLDRAEAAGWQPIGTGPPRGILKADWVGAYHSNDGQRFYARDANRLADALERCLGELSAEERKVWKKFIAYCRAGSFRLF